MNYFKRLLFYYLRYPHDIRMEYNADVNIHADIPGCGAPIHL